MAATRALFSFGVIADVQYGDKVRATCHVIEQLGALYLGENGVTKLNNAVQEWTRRKELSFVLSLGDIIEGNIDTHTTLTDLHRVLEPFQQLRERTNVHHVIGNHCLRVEADVLMEKLGMESLYYSLRIHEGWKLVVLNSNDIGKHANGEVQKAETEAYLDQYPWESQPQIRPWNGGIGTQQLQWLQRELDLAKSLRERVIVACHHPFGKDSARETHMAWNSLHIESTVLQSGVVALVMSGHDHPGGYNCINGTHFLTLPGVVETPDGVDAFAVMHVGQQEIEIEGYGAVETQRLPLTPIYSRDVIS